MGNVVWVFSKFHMLSRCKKCENRLRFDKVTESIKVGTFLRHSVVRPADILVGGLRFYRDGFLLLSFIFRHLPSELAERNSTQIGHMLKSKYDLKMHVQNLWYTPLQIGCPNSVFSTNSQRNGKFNALYLRKEIIHT